MKLPIIVILLYLFVNCNHRNSAPISEEPSAIKFELYVPDDSMDPGTQSDLYAYTHKKKLTNLLSLNALENGTDSFELRFWKVGARIEPIILYILKKSPNNNWSNLHYQLFRGSSSNSVETRNDSLVVEKVRPLTISWETYIRRLNLDSLWTTPSQREIAKDHVVISGISIPLWNLATTKKVTDFPNN